MIYLSFEYLPYHTLIVKLQDLALEEVCEPNKPLQQQRRSVSTLAAAALATSEDRTMFTRIQFKGRFYWCQIVGHMMYERLLKMPENQKFASRTRRKRKIQAEHSAGRQMQNRLCVASYQKPSEKRRRKMYYRLSVIESLYA